MLIKTHKIIQNLSVPFLYSALGIDGFAKYNSRNIMRGLIQEVAKISNGDEIDKVVTIIDKLSRGEILSELEKLGLSEETSEKLLNYFSLDLSEIKSNFLNSEYEMLEIGILELCKLENILNGLALGDSAIFSPSLARGQDYYTGNVFEVYAKNGELSCSLGCGGRYDKMIADFNRYLYNTYGYRD